MPDTVWPTVLAHYRANSDNVKPLAALFRAKGRAALRQTPLFAELPADVWTPAWVVDCRSVGSGQAALKELAPYSFRVALSNKGIVGVADDQVTFRDPVGATGERRTCTLPVLAFVQRFLQHGLPKGCVKVRSYGLFRVGARQALARLRGQLLLQQGLAALAPPAASSDGSATRVLRCPSCGQPVRLERMMPPPRAPPAAPATR